MVLQRGCRRTCRQLKEIPPVHEDDPPQISVPECYSIPDLRSRGSASRVKAVQGRCNVPELAGPFISSFSWTAGRVRRQCESFSTLESTVAVHMKRLRLFVPDRENSSIARWIGSSALRRGRRTSTSG